MAADCVLDACCLINLYASGCVESILKAYGASCHVTSEVRKEVLTVRAPDPTDPTRMIAEPIDMAHLISVGALFECRFTSQVEQDKYIEFAFDVDDGEASCLAIAQSRNWMLATDDPKPIRLALAAGIHIVTTPELLQTWNSVANPEPQHLAEALRRIEHRARFQPQRTNPLRNWWLTAASHASP